MTLPWPGIDGPIYLVAADEDGRRFPCACHTEPRAWLLLTYVGHMLCYACIPLGRGVELRGTLAAQLFENAFNSLADVVSKEQQKKSDGTKA